MSGRGEEGGLKGPRPAETIEAVVEETYAATLDPKRYDALLTAWSSYVDQLPPDGDDFFLTDRVNTHFQRALAILDRMGRAEVREESARVIASQMPGPALVLHPDGGILGINEDCLGLFNGDRPERLGDLHLGNEAHATLHGWLKRNATGAPEDSFAFLSSRFGPEKLQSRLLLSRITLHAGPEVGVEEAILLAVVDVHIDPSMTGRLSAVYGLSEAEADVAIRLARGETPEAIARARRAKLPTVRTQIRHILAKLDVANTTEAVRLLMSFSATIKTARAISSQAPAMKEIDRWQRRHSMTLSDGRRLSWVEQGDPNGRPVLFFHHMYLGPLWTDPSVESLARQGWRVIAPSRPGFGQSDGVSASSLDERIALVNQSIAELIARLGCGPILLLAHANGMIYAQSFAARRPEMTRALLSVGGETSWEDSMVEGLPWQHKVIATTLMRAPSAIGFLARATVAFIDSGREDFLFSTLHRDSPLEQRIARRPEVRSVIMEGLRHTVRQGANALVSEIRMALTDRRPVARQVRVPIRIIHGLEDNVFRPHMFDLFAETVPGVELVPVEGAGQYLLYSHWPLVISEMDKLWRETRPGRLAGQMADQKPAPGSLR